MNKITSKLVALAILIGVALTANFASALVSKTVNTLNENYYYDTNQLVGFGTTSPISRIDIGAGTATIGQMHFASSVLKTIPITGDFEYSAGHWYITNGARHSIDSTSGIKTSDTTVVNTTTETTLYSYTFAAGETHTDEHIFARITGVVSNASASDDYTLRIKLGGTTIHTISRVGGNIANKGWSIVYDGTVRTQGVSGTFVDFIDWGEGSLTDKQADAITHAIDTTIAQTFEITVQWNAAKAGNTITAQQGFLTFKH